MKPLYLYSLLAIGCVALGVGWERERTAHVAAEARMRAWRDSTHAATVRADSAERAFADAKAAYLKEVSRPNVIYRPRIDSLLGQFPAHLGQIDTVSEADTLRLSLLRATIDSAAGAAARKDSLCVAALQKGSEALADKDSALRVATQPPKAPGAKRLALYGVGAWDPIARGVFAAAGAELRLGAFHPFAQLGATIAPATTGQVLVGVRVTF